MRDLVERLRERPFRMVSETEAEAKERRQREREEGAAEIERLRAALREMAQEDGTNARRMRAAIVAARAKLTISRPHWTGPILQADGILAQALTVNNDSAALEDRT